MATTLHDQIAHLATSFAAGVLQAIRGASLDDILAQTSNGSAAASSGAPKRGPGRPRKVITSAAHTPAPAATPTVSAPTAPKRGRGRPKKSVAAATPATPTRGPGRPRKTAATPTASAAPAARKPSAKSGGRLQRRSKADIDRAVAGITQLLKRSPRGLRSEEIRLALNADKRELPRVLAEGLSAKAFTKKGEKRATIYSVK
jgi:hypothetical protein